MGRRRLPTVHDHASLRLRSDGHRVPPDPTAPSHGPAPKTSKGKGKAKDSDTTDNLLYTPDVHYGLHSYRNKHAVQVGQGDWIAKDAVGFVGVPKRRKKDGQEDGSESSGDDQGDEMATPDMLGEGSSNRTEGHRRKKRRRGLVEKDLGFIGGIPASSSNDRVQGAFGAESNGASLPLPSSDLLKCIHHFSSTYYASQGQLINASAEDWRERRKHWTPKSRRKNEPVDEQSNADNILDEDVEQDPSLTEKVKGKKRERLVRKDMYKKLDGTALMAIGMILQEHIAHMLEDSVPPKSSKEVNEEELEDEGEGSEDGADGSVRNAQAVGEESEEDDSEGDEEGS